MRESAAETGGSRDRVAWALACYALFNALLIAAVACLHHLSPIPSRGAAERVLGWDLAAAESLLLMAPGFLIGLAVSRYRPRSGLAVGYGLILAMVLAYGLDLVLYSSVRQRLFSERTLVAAMSMVTWLHTYFRPGNVRTLAIAGGIFAAVQVAGMWGIRRLSERLARSRPLPLRRVGLATGVVLLSPVAAYLWRPHLVARELQDRPARHPLSLLSAEALNTRLIPIVEEDAIVEFRAHLLKLGDGLKRVERNYADLRVTSGPERPRDVLLIIAESLRPESIAKAAPHLQALAAQGIDGREHYSGGNSTTLGMFTMLSGLSPALMPHARKWDMALPRLFRQAGYYTAFVGTGDLQWWDMSDYVNDQDWDYYRVDALTEPYYERDRQFVSELEELFARKGRFQKAADKPVLAVLYAYTTHFDYHHAAEDGVFQPALAGSLDFPPPRGPELYNRYLNSVHALDRVLAPLLTPDRIVVVIGDHGEEFYETGSVLHGTKLVSPQLRTPLIVQAPGLPHREIEGPTTHRDILPTLLGLIGAETNHPGVLSGADLYGESPDRRRRFAFGDFLSEQYGLYAPYIRRRDARDVNDTLVAQFELDLWEAHFAPAHGAWEGTDTQLLRQAFRKDFALWLDEMLETDAGPISEDPVPGIAAGLRSGVTSLQRAAAGLAGGKRTCDPVLLPDLEPCLRCSDGGVRDAARRAIERIKAAN